ncbi:MAG: hypothetical protein U0800_00925 [Isosphaeraceae bacterium]
MSPILYIETNLLVGASKGQDWAEFWEAVRSPIRIALPSVCAMEAMSVFEAETRYRLGFIEAMKQHQREALRDKASDPHAPDLARSLDQAILRSRKLLNTIKLRLDAVLEALAAHADWIPCAERSIRGHLQRDFPPSPTDKLILTLILNDAANRPYVLRAFLSGDAHFGADEIQDELKRSSIRYFKNMASALGWLAHPPEA